MDTSLDVVVVVFGTTVHLPMPTLTPLRSPFCPTAAAYGRLVDWMMMMRSGESKQREYFALARACFKSRTSSNTLAHKQHHMHMQLHCVALTREIAG